MIALITFILVTVGMFVAQWDGESSLKEMYDNFIVQYRKKETLIGLLVFITAAVVFDVLCGF